MSNASEILLLLTSTIDCGSTPFVARRTTEQRLGDYIGALSAWLQVPNLPDLVFCDNSGFDLTPIRDKCRRQRSPHGVRVLSFLGNDGAQTFGKGFGEMEIIRHVLDNTPTILGYRHILKVSGRYFVTNAADMLRKLGGESASVLCNLHQYLTYADSTVFSIAPRAARAHLLPLQAEINDHAGVYFEHVLAKCVSRILADGSQWRPLPCAPILRGAKGTSNWQYPPGLVSKYGRLLLHEMRRGVYGL